jgi:hypothetical protein
LIARRCFTELKEFFAAFDDRHSKEEKKGLFTKSALEGRVRILELSRRGYLSDPPNFNVYTFLRYDSDGLAIWRCHRGTNMLEGAYAWLIRSLSGFASGPEALESFLSVFRWNLNVSQ